MVNNKLIKIIIQIFLFANDSRLVKRVVRVQKTDKSQMSRFIEGKIVLADIKMLRLLLV